MAVELQVGKRIAELRRSKGLTQEKLGLELSVTGQAVSKWENGDSLPDVSLLVSLACVLECSTDYLLGNEKSGGLERLLSTIQAEMRVMEPDQKIDTAFRLFHLIDEISYANVGTVLEKNELPVIHAGRNITLWWKGRFLCIVSNEALKETQTVWTDDNIPFDLFTADWNVALTSLLSRKTYFNPEQPIAEDSIQSELSKNGFNLSVNELMDRGILERGKGGYRLGVRTEVLLRVLGVLLHSVGKPGVVSTNYSHA